MQEGDNTMASVATTDVLMPAAVSMVLGIWLEQTTLPEAKKAIVELCVGTSSSSLTEHTANCRLQFETLAGEVIASGNFNNNTSTGQELHRFVRKRLNEQPTTDSVLQAEFTLCYGTFEIPNMDNVALKDFLDKERRIVSVVFFMPPRYDQFTRCNVFHGSVISQYSVDFAPDSKRFVSAYCSVVTVSSIENAIEKTPQIKLRANNSRCSIRTVAFSTDGNILIGVACNLTLMSLESREPVQTFSGHSQEILAASFSPDGRTFVSGSRDATAKVWSVADGRCLKTFCGHNSEVTHVEFSPDGKMVLSAARQTVMLWCPETGACLRQFPEHSSRITGIAFCPDGRTILTAAGNFGLWSIESGACIRSFPEVKRDIMCFALSPDGKTIAGAIRGCYRLRLWSVDTGTCFHMMPSPYGYVNGAAVKFSPDGKCILGAKQEGRIGLWADESLL